jgi:hypothetical protein
MLTPTHHIYQDLNWLDKNIHYIDREQARTTMVGDWIRKQVLNEARPSCVMIISWRFSRTDITALMSQAEAHTRLLDLPFKVTFSQAVALTFPVRVYMK